MSSALDRLAELVKEAESRSRAQRLGSEMQQAAERLKVAEERARLAESQFSEVRPARLHELEQITIDESRLKDLMRKLAQSLNNLDPERRREAEQHITVAQADITAKRREAEAEVTRVVSEAEVARRELRQSRELYDHLRLELDQILPELASQYVETDRLARQADAILPTGQVHALAREVADGERHFGDLDPREQLAQLRIWVGRFRRLQAMVEQDLAPGLSDEDTHQLREIFPRLVGISKQYWPGYIEAFSRSFETDWDAYVRDAEEQYRRTLDEVRVARETESRRRDAELREREEREVAREGGRDALDELRGVIARSNLPDEGAEEFVEVATRALLGLGAGDAELLELVRPYPDLLGGKDLRALRRRIELLEQGREKEQEAERLRAEFDDVLFHTRNRHALMIGGAVREDVRRSLEQIFDFDDLEWEPYESARPAMLKSLEQRVRNRSMDIVLILKEFVGHTVSESLRPECERQGIPCLMVDRGYGAAQVAEAIRRSLTANNQVD